MLPRPWVLSKVPLHHFCRGNMDNKSKSCFDYVTETTAVVFQQQPMVTVQLFREAPVRTRCPHCGSDVITSTMFETGTVTWLACAITAFVGYV